MATDRYGKPFGGKESPEEEAAEEKLEGEGDVGGSEEGVEMEEGGNVEAEGCLKEAQLFQQLADLHMELYKKFKEGKDGY